LSRNRIENTVTAGGKDRKRRRLEKLGKRVMRFEAGSQAKTKGSRDILRWGQRMIGNGQSARRKARGGGGGSISGGLGEARGVSGRNKVTFR